MLTAQATPKQFLGLARLIGYALVAPDCVWAELFSAEQQRAAIDAQAEVGSNTTTQRLSVTPSSRLGEFCEALVGLQWMFGPMC